MGIPPSSASGDPRPAVARPSVQALARHAHASPVNVGSRERVASAAAGATLVLFGLSRRGLAGTATGLAGAALLTRGATGRCAVYRRLHRDTAAGRVRAHDGAMSRSITIGASADEIRQFIGDPQNLRSILPFVQRVRIDGDLWRIEARLPAGRQLTWSARCSDEGAAGMVCRSQPGSPFEHELRLAFEPAPGDRGTQVHATLHVRPPGGLAGAAVARWLRGLGARGIGVALARLKQRMEAGEIATTANQSAAPRSRMARVLSPLRRPEPRRREVHA